MNKKGVRFFKLFNKKVDKNHGSYGQASMETLAVAGFAILIFVVAIVMFYYYSGSSQDALTEGQAEKVVNTLVAKADELAVYDVGFSTQIQLDIPEGLEDDIVFNPRNELGELTPTKEIAIKIKTSNNAISTIAGRATFATIEGKIYKTPGLKTVSLCSKEGKVCIVELQPGQSCLDRKFIVDLCPNLEGTITPRRSTSCNNGRRDVNEVCDGVIFNESAPLCQQNEVRSCVSCNVTCTPTGNQTPVQPIPGGIQSVTYEIPFVLQGSNVESYPSAIIRKVNGIPDDYRLTQNENTAFYGIIKRSNSQDEIESYKNNPVYETFEGLLQHRGEWLCNQIGNNCLDQNNPDNYIITGGLSGSLTFDQTIKNVLNSYTLNVGESKTVEGKTVTLNPGVTTKLTGTASDVSKEYIKLKVSSLVYDVPVYGSMVIEGLNIEVTGITKDRRDGRLLSAALNIGNPKQVLEYTTNRRFSSDNSDIANIEYGLYDYTTLNNDGLKDNSDVNSFGIINSFIITLKDGSNYYYSYPVYVASKTNNNRLQGDYGLIDISNGDNAFTKGDYSSYSYKGFTVGSQDEQASKFMLNRYAYAWLLTKVEKPGSQPVTFSYTKRFSQFISPYDARLMSIKGNSYSTNDVWPAETTSGCRDAITSNRNIITNCRSIGFTQGYMEIAQKI